ncbi:MAG: hypothetical protein J5953_01560, partial [Prevotella sp.]|nr:hypothetical protein [Prevotella sp.]
TKKAMKKITHIGMAALVAMGMLGTSCNKAESPEIETPETQKENIVTLTTTVGFAADGTKALTSTGVKTFAEGETMAIYYWKNKGNDHEKAVSAPLTAGDITNGGKSATFTFTLDNPYKDMSVVYTYPAAIANADFTPNYDALYNNQDGTRATLASDFDFCTKSGAWAGDNLPSLTLENQLAILAITLKNAGGSSDITSGITGLTLSDGTYTYNVSRSAAAGPIYVAIRPTSDATITVTATDGTKNYTKTLTGKTYTASNGYPVSWRIAEAYTLAESTVGMIVGSDGKAYAASDKNNLPSAGVTAAGMVAYKDGSNGLVIALADEANTMNWSTANGASGAAAHTPAVTGQTWKLPSKAEWNQMFGNDADEIIANYMSLNDAISTAGGTAFQEGGFYWSSTEFEDGIAYVELDCGSAYWRNNDDEDEDYRVRACLAF